MLSGVSLVLAKGSKVLLYFFWSVGATPWTNKNNSRCKSAHLIRSDAPIADGLVVP